LWLKSEYRNKGIGKKMVERFEKKSQKKGKKFIAVHITDESKEFWKKLGYTYEPSIYKMVKKIGIIDAEENLFSFKNS
jgi:GNAT superfamily N-acetyltransferase